MKSNFTNENMEEFLRHSTDGLRMRPSDKVWKGISSELNKKRRGGYRITGFLVFIALFGYLAVERAVTISNPFQTPSQASSNSLTSQGEGLAKSIPATGKSSNRAEKQLSIDHPPSAVPVHSRIAHHLTGTDNEITTEEVYNTIVDSYEPEANDQQGSQHASSPKSQTNNKYPLTIESVVNSYRKRNGKKMSYQFYFTPTISYRRLTENKTFLRSQPDAYVYPAAMYSVNNVVTHKPNVGLQVGMAARYPVAQNLHIRGGLQLNINRYDIKAYNTSAAVTTIMLNTSNSRPDSIYAMSNLSNTGGYQSDWLQNFYFQISAPIGVEYRIKGDEKLNFGIATTIQPTYVLGDRAYLISTDYKNYAEMPNLTRRWNVNTALETFVGYSTGHISWQVGPQVRYQLLSSYVAKYPIKENLFDFGLRVGLTLNK